MSSSSKMALYIPMQPSSKTPMMAFTNELGGERLSQGHLQAAAEVVDVVYVAGFVRQLPGLQPRAQSVPGPAVREVLAPQRRVSHRPW